MQRAFITGGAGFIGSTLSEKLLSSGKRVVVIDNFDTFYDPEIKRRNVETASSHDNYELVEGDIRSTEDLDRCLELAGVNHVVGTQDVFNDDERDYYENGKWDDRYYSAFRLDELVLHYPRAVT